MNAAQARLISQEAMIIMDRISSAAFIGKREITARDLSQQIIDNLIKLGYGVSKSGSEFTDVYYVIKW